MGAFTRYVEQFGNTVAERLAGMALDAIRNKPLDHSHHPFKRSDETGPGPGKRGVMQQKHWECGYGGPYVQLCKYVGPPGHGIRPGYTKKVVTKKARKLAYNKRYEKFLKEEGLPAPHRNPNAFLPDYMERMSDHASTASLQRARRAALKKAAKIPKAKPVKKAAKKPAKAKKAS